jgi:hypothetical protein
MDFRFNSLFADLLAVQKSQLWRLDLVDVHHPDPRFLSDCA